MLGGRGSYIQCIVDMLILYTLYTTVYTVNMNFILHNGGILENHYQWVFHPPSLHKTGSWHSRQLAFLYLDAAPRLLPPDWRESVAQPKQTTNQKKGRTGHLAAPLSLSVTHVFCVSLSLRSAATSARAPTLAWPASPTCRWRARRRGAPGWSQWGSSRRPTPCSTATWASWSIRSGKAGFSLVDVTKKKKKRKQPPLGVLKSSKSFLQFAAGWCTPRRDQAVQALLRKLMHVQMWQNIKTYML